ncbi:lipase family protein [Azospirillum sp. 11R-A]|uniref:lipase family protein n=1 Tax=Azospirillum sp. 11R-A TaxID=3111634 RepID=UPI003C1E0509
MGATMRGGRAGLWLLCILSAVCAAGSAAAAADDAVAKASDLAVHASARGSVLEVATLATYRRDAIEAGLGSHAGFIGRPRCDVTLSRVTYATIGVHGEPATASAMLLLPGGPDCGEPHELLGWAQGTQTRQDASQADGTLAAGDSPLLTFYAARGVAVAATDYLGLGRSDYPFHPYLHAESEASAIVDALRAARSVAAEARIPLSGKVLLAGYSQGGHASMAAQRTIERDHAGEFHLAGTAPMSGPYALEQTFIDGWSATGPAGPNGLATALFAYAVVAMQRVYANIYASPADVFRSPFDATVEGVMPGRLDIFDVLRQGVLPPGPEIARLRQDGFTRSFDDPQAPFRRALAGNDLLDWTPRAPMVLCGAGRDAVVPFANTLTAKRLFTGRGAAVEVLDMDDRIPAELDGVSVHTSAAVYLCFGATRDRLLALAR